MYYCCCCYDVAIRQLVVPCNVNIRTADVKVCALSAIACIYDELQYSYISYQYNTYT